jgi:hypothetical protein
MVSYIGLTREKRDTQGPLTLCIWDSQTPTAKPNPVIHVNHAQSLRLDVDEER